MSYFSSSSPFVPTSAYFSPSLSSSAAATPIPIPRKRNSSTTIGRAHTPPTTPPGLSTSPASPFSLSTSPSGLGPDIFEAFPLEPKYEFDEYSEWLALTGSNISSSMPTGSDCSAGGAWGSSSSFEFEFEQDRPERASYQQGRWAEAPSLDVLLSGFAMPTPGAHFPPSSDVHSPTFSTPAYPYSPPATAAGPRSAPEMEVLFSQLACSTPDARSAMMSMSVGEALARYQQQQGMGALPPSVLSGAALSPSPEPAYLSPEPEDVDADGDGSPDGDQDQDQEDSDPSTGSSSPYYSPSPSPPQHGQSRRPSSSSHSKRVLRIPIPVPVPNLTKKSRGRHVPTASTAAAAAKGRTYTCTVAGCGKCFQRGEHLKRHVRSIHTHEKPHECNHPECGKVFSRFDNLRQHMRVHRKSPARGSRGSS